MRSVRNHPAKRRDPTVYLALVAVFVVAGIGWTNAFHQIQQVGSEPRPAALRQPTAAPPAADPAGSDQGSEGDALAVAPPPQLTPEATPSLTLEPRGEAGASPSPTSQTTVTATRETTPTPAATSVPTSPTTSPTPRPIGRAVITEYRVESGDTVYAIAGRYGVDTARIIVANGLSRDAAIRNGQTLFIPSVPGVVHTVETGDTLAGLVRTYGVSPSSIAEANALNDAEPLRPGSRLLIPGVSGPPPPPASTFTPTRGVTSTTVGGVDTAGRAGAAMSAQ